MIKRELYLSRIRPFIGNELIKILTGIRRSGKSVMLELIKEELMERGVSKSQFISINFEQMKNAPLRTASALHEDVLKRIQKIDGKPYLFFDEIQEVDAWERCINSLRVDCDCDIYVTGSNAKMLSGEFATYLAGRYVEFIIYPFSFAEFLEMVRRRNPQIDNSTAFRDFLSLGGMPFLTNLVENHEAATQYLRDVYNSVVLKDILKRNKIRDVDLLERIITYMLAEIGHPLSASSLSKYFKSENRKVSHETILNYIKGCTEAYLFYRVSRQDLVGKKILTVGEKYYVADHGLREAVYGKNTQNIDQVLENIVFMELLRRNYKPTVGKTANHEIDFVCEKQGQKLYVQVTYLLASPKTIEREFRAYDAIRDNFPKYVVSLDEFDMSRDGIKHMNIRDFLLAPEWN